MHCDSLANTVCFPYTQANIYFVEFMNTQHPYEILGFWCKIKSHRTIKILPTETNKNVRFSLKCSHRFVHLNNVVQTSSYKCTVKADSLNG